MSLHVDEEKDNVTIVLTGPSASWFGVGLNAQKMADMPYTIIVNSTGVIEQKIGTCGSEADHCPGTLLPSSQINLQRGSGDKRCGAEISCRSHVRSLHVQHVKLDRFHSSLQWVHLRPLRITRLMIFLRSH